MTVEILLFWAFAVLTVVSAGGVVLAKSPINSAMSLVATFFFLAGVYILLWAHTVAVIQVLVYAGAIMVLFLFVIMLLAIGDTSGPTFHFTVSRVVGGFASLGLLAVLVVVMVKTPAVNAQMTAEHAQTFGTLKQMGVMLYTQYLLPFEAISLLLLAAIVGAVVVSKSRI